MNLPWLTILILVPLFGGIVVAGLGAEQKRLARGLALMFSLVGLIGALCLWNILMPLPAACSLSRNMTGLSRSASNTFWGWTALVC